MDPQGQRFYQYIMRCVPPHAQAEVERVFQAGMREGETRNYISVFLNMVAECSHWR